jgi:hypothetical protein
LQLATQNQLVEVYPRGNGTWSAPNGYLDTSTNIIKKIELYVNNIFVNPEIHEIFVKRIGFSLIRIHRQQTFTLSDTVSEVLLQQLKWPIEALFIGAQVADYNSSDAALNRQNMDKWCKFAYITPTSYSATGFNLWRTETLTGTGVSIDMTGSVGTVTGVGTDFDGSVAGGAPEISAGEYIVINGAMYQVQSVTSPTVLELGADIQPLPPTDVALTADFHKALLEPATTTADVATRTISSMILRAHGIPLYNDYPAAFFNVYQPYHFGGYNIRSPEDIGAMMMTFALYPGTFQPSGHINVSRSREFYLTVSSIFTSSLKGTLVVLASAINFLLISDGSAVIRYST